ncbi:bifunctional nicotinamidase/pyrazinamidase [Microvirga sp. W0021]|uniref:nicotinamidase n=1 Tax=Hohaiivirga grylli TaxID=3133970 RepID=A0ABV0BIY7_9HYPH
MRYGSDSVLLVVDIQNDFLPGGALAVPEGDQVIEPINLLAERFQNVILTQDWHPEAHISFASSHEDKQPYEMIELDYGPQILWPDHCIQGERGAEFASGLNIPKAELVIRKGHHPTIDSYSAFLEADRATRTGLASYLQERGIRNVYCAGLALDFCVSWTAIDAITAGFDTFIIEEACRAIDTNGSLEHARHQWDEMGIVIM